MEVSEVSESRKMLKNQSDSSSFYQPSTINFFIYQVGSSSM